VTCLFGLRPEDDVVLLHGLGADVRVRRHRENLDVDPGVVAAPLVDGLAGVDGVAAYVVQPQEEAVDDDGGAHLGGHALHELGFERVVRAEAVGLVDFDAVAQPAKGVGGGRGGRVEGVGRGQAVQRARGVILNTYTI